MENKEKELSFKEKLEKDIFAIAKQMQQLHKVENKHYAIEECGDEIYREHGKEVYRKINSRCKIFDFRDYLELTKVLEKNIRMYCDHNFVNGSITSIIQNELNLITYTSSLSLEKKYMPQYNTLVTITDLLNKLKKQIDSCTKRNTKINDEVSKSNPVFLEQIAGKYGNIKRGGQGLNPSAIKYELEIYDYDENYEAILNKELSYISDGLPNGINEEDYFKMSLVSGFTKIQDSIEKQIRFQRENHNIENAILKLNKTLEKCLDKIEKLNNNK